MRRPRYSRYERELKSEERRALIWLGLLATIVAFDFWLRDRPNNPDPTFNFICDYPCPHVTFSWIPFLDRLTFFWILYAICMLIYFSEDIFIGSKLWKRIRHHARNLGHGFLILWPATFAWAVVFSEGFFLIQN